MHVRPIRTRIFLEGEALLPFLMLALKKLPEKSVVVIASKIVALSEGRTVIAETEADRDRVIRQESDDALRTKYTWLTVKGNMVMKSAGVDRSNANGKLILLPKDSFASAAKIRRGLKKAFGVKELGVIISDTWMMPLRKGAINIALGYAGIAGIKKYQGKKDLFGRAFSHSWIGAVDSLATAGGFAMGEGEEQQPIAIITDAPVEFKERIDRKELEVDVRDDIYLPIFQKIKKK